MKKIILPTIFLFACFSVSQAQTKWHGLDKSPLDVSFYPDNFVHDRKDDVNVVVRVIYSRPQKKDRDVFGGLVPYGKVWRTGANESTEIKFYKDVTIGDKEIKAGTYSLFTIPGEEEWTIILNSNVDYWGAYSYDEQKDVLRTTVKPQHLSDSVEALTIQFADKGEDQAIMKLAWDKTMVEVPVKF